MCAFVLVIPGLLFRYFYYHQTDSREKHQLKFLIYFLIPGDTVFRMNKHTRTLIYIHLFLHNFQCLQPEQTKGTIQRPTHTHVHQFDDCSPNGETLTHTRAKTHDRCFWLLLLLEQEVSHPRLSRFWKNTRRAPAFSRNARLLRGLGPVWTLLDAGCCTQVSRRRPSTPGFSSNPKQPTLEHVFALSLSRSPAGLGTRWRRVTENR